MNPEVRVVLLAAALLFGGTSAARSQDPRPITITGHVLEAGTGAPVHGAVIESEDLGRPVVTDDRGRFLLEEIEPGSYRLAIRQLGYIDQIQTLAFVATTSILVHLYPEPILQQKIAVTIDRLESRHRAVPYAVRTFDQGDLARFPALDLEEFLKRRTGLHFVPCPTGRGAPATTASQCVLHRGRPTELSVYLDDVPLPAGTDALYSILPIDLHSVEFIRSCAMVRAYTKRFLEEVADGRRTLYPTIRLDCF